MKKLILSITGLVFLLSISSCIKEKFDAPPTGGQDPNVVINYSIDSLQKYATGAPIQITRDLIIEAVVVADDKSGNFYKQLVIQDSTAGITLLMDAGNLYTAYPIGRRLFINLKGLYVGNYKSTPQLFAGVNPDGTFAGIPPALFDQFITKGTFPHFMQPKVLHIYSLNNHNIDELIQFDDVEFVSTDAGAPFADGINKTSKTTTLQDCAGATIASYNSGYSDFASVNTPVGKGTVLVIYSTYNGAPQISFRSLDDFSFTGPRCP